MLEIGQQPDTTVPPKAVAATLSAHRFTIVQDFWRATWAASGPQQLRDALCDAVWALGFDYFSFQHRLCRLRLTSLPAKLGNPPPASDDPVLAAAKAVRTPFLWSDIPRLVSLTPRQRDVMAGAAKAGLGEGFTVPMQDGDKLAGFFSFITRPHRALPADALPAAHHIAAIAFETVHALARNQVQTSTVLPALTRRQLDCVVLVAQGKSDWEIGQLLGIGESTVHKHIEDAKRRYGVSTRIQLVVRGLFGDRLPDVSA